MLVFHLTSADPSTPIHVLSGHVGLSSVRKIHKSMLLSNGEDKTVRIWDLESGTCLHVLLGHSTWIGRPVFNSDGQGQMAISDLSGQVKVWDLGNGCVGSFLSLFPWFLYSTSLIGVGLVYPQSAYLLPNRVTPRGFYMGLGISSPWIAMA